VIKKAAEKILKYKDFITEMQCMWNVKENWIPLITGATGTISKSLGHYLSDIPRRHEIEELQEPAVLGTSESANVIVQNKFHGRNNITSSTNCKYRTATTLYTLETWFVSGT
jgi:hypothetical protein